MIFGDFLYIASPSTIVKEKIRTVVVENFPMLGKAAAWRFLEWVQENPQGLLDDPKKNKPSQYMLHGTGIFADTCTRNLSHSERWRKWWGGFVSFPACVLENDPKENMGCLEYWESDALFGCFRKRGGPSSNNERFLFEDDVAEVRT